MTLVEILTPILGSVTTGIAAIFAYRVGRRKNNADARNSELQNVEDAIKIWRETAEAMARKAEEITARSEKDYQRLFDQNVELLNLNKLLVVKITKLEREIEHLKKTV